MANNVNVFWAFMYHVLSGHAGDRKLQEASRLLAMDDPKRERIILSTVEPRSVAHSFPPLTLPLPPLHSVGLRRLILLL